MESSGFTDTPAAIFHVMRDLRIISQQGKKPYKEKKRKRQGCKIEYLVKNEEDEEEEKRKKEEQKDRTKDHRSQMD